MGDYYYLLFYINNNFDLYTIYKEDYTLLYLYTYILIYSSSPNYTTYSVNNILHVCDNYNSCSCSCSCSRSNRR